MPTEGQIEPSVGTVYNVPDVNVVPEGKGSHMYTDLSAGLLINTSLFYFGGTVDHLFEPSQNSYSLDYEGQEHVLNRKYSILFGCDFRKNAESSMIFSPQVYYQKQGDYNETWLSLGMRYRKVAFGGGFSDRGNYVASAGLNFDMFQLTYKYDKSKSWSLNESMPSHEVTARIYLQQKDKYSGYLLSYN